MKLYCFDYNNYGEFYLVMASSFDEALVSVRKYLLGEVKHKTLTSIDGSRHKTCRYEEYLKWKKATVDELPEGFSLRILNKGEVFCGEWA